MNENRQELKTQYLPGGYSEYFDQFIQGEERSFSLLEKLILNQNSYFYLNYKSDNAFSLKINNGVELVLPASNEHLTVQIFQKEKTVLDSFNISTDEAGCELEIFECGLVAADSGTEQREHPLLIYTEKDISIYNEIENAGSGISMVLQAEEISSRFNVAVQVDGTDDYLIKTREGLNQYWFYGVGNYPISKLILELDYSQLIGLEFNIQYVENEAIATDLETFITWDKEAWRQKEYELFRWDLFPDMLLIDTLSYEIQSAFFKRLAFFTEKKISAGELVDDQFLKPLHGWNAHDYRAEDLARFFNKAELDGFSLNEHELLLRELLLESDVLRKTGSRVRPYKGGILSISRESNERLRWLFLTHECYHGLFFSSDEYIARVTEIWNSLAEEEREFWRIFLDMYGYDINDEYLLINEFQAYLMQQNIGLADSYFRGKINWILQLKPYLKRTFDTLLSNHGDTFSRSAEAVENAAYTLTGIRAGDLVLKRKK